MTRPRSRKARARLRREAQAALETVHRLSTHPSQVRLYIDELGRPLRCPACAGSGLRSITIAQGTANAIPPTAARCLTCEGRGKLRPRWRMSRDRLEDLAEAIRRRGKE